MKPVNQKDTKSFGLAFSGGGARGLAHIGVLKVLEDAGLQPAYLAGASMGGVIGALSAVGWSALRIEDEVLNMIRPTRMVRLMDVSRPRRGLLEGSRVRQYLAELLGSETIFAQLHTPLALACVDLSTGREVTLQDGPLVESLMATIAVPGIFPAVKIGKMRLVDGGVLNNLPVDIARRMGAEVTTGVDVSPCLDEIFGDHPESHLLPPVFPSFARDFYLAELIMVSALTKARLEANPPDLIIRPEIPPEISIFWGFGRAAEAIAAGERAARQALPRLQSLLNRSSAS